jgi:hypothetical protein
LRTALVLGCDLTPDGTALGSQTISRLERGLRFAETSGYRLVVAAGHSPRHSKTLPTMAELMDTWLQARGYGEALVLCATQFRTKGEVVAFMALPEAGAIISDQVHLDRTRDLIARLYGSAIADSLCYIPTDGVAMSERARRLEPVKRFYIRHVPLFLDDVIWKTVTWVTVRMKLNLSY